MIATAVLALVVLYLVYKLVWGALTSDEGTPPGPWGLPVVGYLPFLGLDPTKTFKRLHEKFGDIFRVNLGGVQTVLIGDFASCKEALGQSALLSRPPGGVFPAFHEYFRYQLADINGESWVQHRRFILQSFRDLGYGKHSMEVKIQEEADNFVSHLKSKGGKAVDMEHEMKPSVTNNILSLLIGRTLPYQDEEHQFVDYAITLADKFAGQSGICVFFPWLIPLFTTFGIAGYKEFNNAMKRLKAFLKREYEDHKKTLDPANLRDYMDHFILRMQDPKSDPQIFDEEHLLGNSFIFFAGGTNTILQSMRWFVILMCRYPDVMRKCQKEVDDVIGRERWPNMADSSKMPYTRAFLKELQRFVTIVPLDVVRFVSEDTKIGGYKIPKGWFVICNMLRAHNDPRCWSDPQDFSPERFLDSEDKMSKVQDGYMPFSLGKRNCPGEGLANIELFIYTAFILQRFDIKPENTGRPVDITPDYSSVLALPPEQKICFIDRR